jgi:hypothetical protein
MKVQMNFGNCTVDEEALEVWIVTLSITDLLTALGVLLACVSAILAAIGVALILAGIISFKYFETISKGIARKTAKEEAQIIAAHAVNDFIAKSLPDWAKMRDSMTTNFSDEEANQIAENQDPNDPS